VHVDRVVRPHPGRGRGPREIPSGGKTEYLTAVIRKILGTDGLSTSVLERARPANPLP